MFGMRCFFYSAREVECTYVGKANFIFAILFPSSYYSSIVSVTIASSDYSCCFFEFARTSRRSIWSKWNWRVSMSYSGGGMYWNFRSVYALLYLLGILSFCHILSSRPIFTCFSFASFNLFHYIVPLEYDSYMLMCKYNYYIILGTMCQSISNWNLQVPFPVSFCFFFSYHQCGFDLQFFLLESLYSLTSTQH